MSRASPRRIAADGMVVAMPGMNRPQGGTPPRERDALAVALDDAAGIAGTLLARIRRAFDDRDPAPPEQNVYDLIVPNFNAPEFLQRCLDSLIAHTDHRHLIHVVDDASTDPRVDPLLRRYASRYPHLRYYRLPANLGFPGAVNAALASTARDVVLVNSDTEFPPGWLARMDRCRRSDPSIHAVSPLSNNATICSVPAFNARNALPPNVDLAEMDRLVQATSLRRYPPMPTAVGFCMLMTRRVIEEVGPFDMVFGRGYGEEVDWCQRAWARGFASVICDDVYVFHHGEAGFSHVPSRNTLRRANERRVAERWPRYLPSLQAYCLQNPLRLQQQMLFERLRRLTAARMRVLHVTHSFDQAAGTEIFVRQQVDGMRDEVAGTVLYPAPLSPFADGSVDIEGRGLLADGLLKVRMNTHLFATDHAIRGATLSLRAPDAERFFADVLAGARADIVQFSHFANLGSLAFPLVARALGAKVVVVLHDYFLLCPDWNLLHAEGRACGEAKADADNARCIDCLGRRLQSRPGAAAPDLPAWLRQRAELACAVLEQADALVAPSSFVRAQFTRAWGEGIGGRIRVIPHGTVAHPFEPGYAPCDDLRVAFVGNATKFKGIDTFVAAAHRLSPRRVRFSVLGGLPPGHGLRASGNLELCGPYVPRELSRLLQDVDVVVIGSVAHETYCYTLDEAYRAGTPVIATAMGAIPERVADGQTGLLVPPGDADALVDAIDRLDRDRSLLARMRRNVDALRLRSVADMVAEYRQLHEELASSGREIDTVCRAMQAQSAEISAPPVTLGAYAAAHEIAIALPLTPEGGTVRAAGRKDTKAR